jgi:PKD repeat protein
VPGFPNIETAFYQFDPAASFAWDFGDGTSSTDRNPTRQYANDGNYTVQHTITTLSDGTSSISKVVQVRTHDVAITKIVAPSSARVGQTRPITIYLKNNCYAEMVLLELYKSNPNVAGGFELVGFYTQFVPVRSGSRTSAFTFNYTFTSSDANIGKVTFKAIATIVGARDLIPDNELSSSPPTIVRK